MAGSVFHCPKCSSPLKTAAPLAPGKKIKCPKCATVFAVPAQGTAPAAAVQAKPRPQPAAAPKPAPLPKKAVADAAPPPAPRKPLQKPAPVNDFEDEGGDQENDFETLPTRTAPGQRRPATKGGGKMVVVLGALVLLLAGGVAVGGFVWPGFLKTKAQPKNNLVVNKDNAPPKDNTPRDPDVNYGTGNEDPVAYLPPDSNFFMGTNVGADLSMPVFGEQLRTLSTMSLQQAPALADFQTKAGVNLLDLCDRVWMGAAVTDFKNLQNPPKAGVLVLKSKTPFDQKKIGEALMAQDKFLTVEKSKANEKTYYKVKVKNAPPNEPAFIVYMPSNQVLVAALESSLDAVTKSDGTAITLPAEALALLRNGEKGSDWLVVSVTDAMRAEMQKAAANAPSMVPPDLLNALVQAKAAGIWTEVQGGQGKLNIHLTCADEPTAKKVAQTVQGLVVILGSTLLSKDKLPPVDSVRKLVEELQTNFKAGNEGATAQLSTSANLQTLQDVANEAPKLMGGGQASGPGPGPAPFPGSGQAPGPLPAPAPSPVPDKPPTAPPAPPVVPPGK